MMRQASWTGFMGKRERSLTLLDDTVLCREAAFFNRVGIRVRPVILTKRHARVAAAVAI